MEYTLFDGPLVNDATNKNPHTGAPLNDAAAFKHYYEQAAGDVHQRRRTAIVCLYDLHKLPTPQVAAHVPASEGKCITPQSLACYKVRVVKRCGAVTLAALEASATTSDEVVEA